MQHRTDRQFIVTTSRRPTDAQWAEAAHWAERLDAPLVARRGGIATTCQFHGVIGAVVVGADRVTYHEPANDLQYFYHPGMARVRMQSIRRGRGDPMVSAMRLQPGDGILDCTLGRASDAIVAAHVVGDAGRVVGLEVSSIIAQLTIHGLATYEDNSPRLTAAMRRIEAHQRDYREYLPQADADAFDVVYFDPIFHAAVDGSEQMVALRELGDSSALDSEAVLEARRVARRCVVIKQRCGTPLWEQLGVDTVIGNPSTRVQYGVIEADREA